MASKLALSLVIGGAVASSVGAAFNTVEDRIGKLEKKGNKAKVLKSTIGETVKLREEWKRAHDTGAAGADKLLRKLEGNLTALRKQGVEVGRLGQEYKRLAREAKAADLQVKGHQQISAGKSALTSNLGKAAVGVGLTAIPTKISADYQAIIRDIAIKADAVNTPQEVQLSRTVIGTADSTGMARNDVADLINQLVGAGMELDKAMAYAPTAAKFAIGQGASGVDTASMIMALQQNAKINDPKVMQQALEAIAYQGQAGSFEASDMARWFPQLLASMEKNGSTGLDAVTSLGSMLQVQMKTAGSSDEAANNFKNWVEKIGSGDVVKAYADVGIDYQGSLNTGIQKGMSSIESSMALAMKYVEATDPAKAQKIKDAKAKISSEVDPEKAKAALDALEKSLRTGDLFADMQVKAALTAYSQNKELYEQLKNDSKNSSGILDKNLAERRETSSQRWAETAQSVDDAMRSIGDAIRPITDKVAVGITNLAKAFVGLSDGSQTLVAGAVAAGAAFIGLKTAVSAFTVGKGMLNVLRGKLGAVGGKEVQKVFVTNAGDSDGGDEGGGRREKVLGLLESGLKAFSGKPGSEESPEDSGKFNPIGAGLKVLDIFREAGGEDGGGDSPPELQKVFVVNANDFGASGVRGEGNGGERGRRRRRGARRNGRGNSGGGPRPPPRPVPPPPQPPGGAGRLGRMMSAAGKATAVVKRLPGGNLLNAGLSVVDTAMNATTQDEKAEGYGGAAGGLAGAMAGGAMGAALGSVVPVIGTVIGGAIGAAIGGMGGESLGGFLGKKWFGEDEEKPEEPAPAVKQEDPPAAPISLAASAVPPAPAISYDPRDPNSKDPFLVPALTANKVRFPGAALAKPPAAAPEAPAAPAAPAVSYDPRDPNSKDPFLVPALTANRVRLPGAGLAPPTGNVVRDMAATAAPAASAPELAKAAAPKGEAPKVDQAFTFSPTSTITVQGDVKDPAQLARELEPHMRAQWETFQREQGARAASNQMFDAAHI
ncbi:phage tail tape measure protein [Pseudomonas lundensis]|uniref:phage tail tape measure protein n=1 Tax=Pseudomonas lundensis TaxID=86185 RepID=UPI00089DD110|nr:phage tail tape measure protein [Pseudomonas lundensis]